MASIVTVGVAGQRVSIPPYAGNGDVRYPFTFELPPDVGAVHERLLTVILRQDSSGPQQPTEVWLAPPGGPAIPLKEETAPSEAVIPPTDGEFGGLDDSGGLLDLGKPPDDSLEGYRRHTYQFPAEAPMGDWTVSVRNRGTGATTFLVQIRHPGLLAHLRETEISLRLIRRYLGKFLNFMNPWIDFDGKVHVTFSPSFTELTGLGDLEYDSGPVKGLRAGPPTITFDADDSGRPRFTASWDLGDGKLDIPVFADYELHDIGSTISISMMPSRFPLLQPYSLSGGGRRASSSNRSPEHPI